jgi:molybdopterin-guanine dinucleotide biosynthesis protein A
MFDSFILAGGKSSRMKNNKAFLKLGEKTLLEHSLSTLQEIKSNRIYVVVADNSNKFDNFSVIIDIYKNRGTLGGIHSSLAHCKEKYAVIIACDYPFVSPKLLNYLLEFAENDEVDCIAPIQKDGIIQPLCAVYKTQKCLSVLTAILKESNKTPSARTFLEQINTNFIEFVEFAEMPNSEYFFFNINTPEDFKKAIEIKKLVDEK